MLDPRKYQSYIYPAQHGWQQFFNLLLQVPTVDGNVDLKIPAGTQPGTTLLMSKRGVPKMSAGRNVRGNQQVCYRTVQQVKVI